MSEEFVMVEGTSAKPPRKYYIESTEEMTGLEFPADWIEFLYKNNGGVPERKFFKLEEDVGVVTTFLCLDAEYKTSETGETDVGVVWSQIEERLSEFQLPFAATFGGDFLLFEFEGEDGEIVDVPTVVLWNHDLSEEDEPVTSHVSDSFSSFLDMLSDKED